MGGPDPERNGIAPAQGACWRFGPFEVDERLRELRRDGKVLTIEPKPLNMLLLLVRHPGALLTRNDLIETLWTGRIVSDSVLASCVAKLRLVLGDEDQTLIRTVHGYGYRFEGQPQRVDGIAPVAPAALDLRPGQSPALRPNWKLVRRLGKSGETWLAEHQKTHQSRVFKFGDGPEALSRLKREVTLYRLLQADLGDSLAVTPILDWNFDEPPWFVESSYASGGSLQEWAELHGGAGQLPFAQRLTIVIQIADTLAAVHQIGVLHKDLKPANVLIQPTGDEVQVRLCDFGSGLLLDPQRLEELSITRLGFTVMAGDDGSGTPLYLAPEVVAGQPTTVRSDIYALGVMLFQLVVGDLRRPLAPGWERDIDDELLREDIARAAEGNPARRLADAALLAQRLRTLEPRRRERSEAAAAQLKAETEARDLAHFRARRSRLLIVVGALSLGLAISGVLYWQARQARLAAEVQTHRAEAVSAFLSQDVLDQIGSSDQPVKDLTVKQLLDVAKDSVETRFADQPELAAQVYESIGHSYAALDQDVAAIGALEAALKIRQTHPDAATLHIAEMLVTLHYHAGDLPQNLARFEAIAAQASAGMGPREIPVLEMRLGLARGYNLLGQWQRGGDQIRQLRSDAAAAHVDAAFATRIDQALSYVDNDLARYAEAESVLKGLIDKAADDHGGDNFNSMLSHLRLSRTYTEMGRYAEAESQFAQTLALIDKWEKSKGGSMFTYNLYLAHLRNEQGRPAEAAALMESQLKVVIGLDVGTMDQSFNERRILAESYRQLGRLDEAEDQIRRCLASVQQALGPTHPWTRDARIALADILRERGRNDAAWQVLNDAPILSMRDLPDDHPYAADLNRVIGLLLLARGDVARARESLNAAWRQTAAVFPEDHWRCKRLRGEIKTMESRTH